MYVGPHVRASFTQMYAADGGLFLNQSNRRAISPFLAKLAGNQPVKMMERAVRSIKAGSSRPSSSGFPG